MASALTIYNGVCSKDPDVYSATPCFTILIEDSTFMNFGKMK